MNTETMNTTVEGSNYLKAVRKRYFLRRYIEVNGEAIVKGS
jgi:hypothetical protein